jgi:hypothetical protein
VFVFAEDQTGESSYELVAPDDGAEASDSDDANGKSAGGA